MQLLNKRKRVDFDEKVELLKQAWHDGLRSASGGKLIVPKQLEEYSFGIVHPSRTIGQN